jgi:sec-independent protein translocase protein TatA
VTFVWADQLGPRSESDYAFFVELGIGEILVVLVVVLLLFGPSKLPQLGEALGRGIRNFKKATTEDDEPAKPEAQTIQTAQPPAALPAGTAPTQAPAPAAGEPASARPTDAHRPPAP